MTARSRPLWVLRLIPPVKFGRTIYAIATLTVLLSICQLTGVFEPQPGRVTSMSATLFFAVLLAYIVPALDYIVARSEEAFDEIAPHLDASRGEIDWWRASIRLHTPFSQLAVITVGIAAGVLHNVVLADPDSAYDVLTRSSADATVVIGTVLVWLFMTTAINGLLNIARLFARLAAHVRIDLLQPRRLTPFARVAVISTLALIGAQAAFPIMWLGDDDLTSRASVPGLIATGVPMLFLFAMPLLPIHRAIMTAKTTILQSLDEKVALIRASTPGADDEPLLAELLPLLVYRREVEAAREWPFDSNIVSRLAAYLVIPPLTWVGAALIERIVEGAL